MMATVTQCGLTESIVREVKALGATSVGQPVPLSVQIVAFAQCRQSLD